MKSVLFPTYHENSSICPHNPNINAGLSSLFLFLNLYAKKITRTNDSLSNVMLILV